MNPIVAQSILGDCRVAYAITDHYLNVLELGGATNIFHNNNYRTGLGRSLFHLAPELIGFELVLTKILAGKLSRFQLDLVNRETTSETTIDLTLIVLPYRAKNGQISGLIHIAEDITELGVLAQTLTQQRSELHQLRRRLTYQNLKLATANTELQRLNELKSTTISESMVELYSPLLHITDLAELLLDTERDLLTENQRQCLEIIDQNARRLQTVTEKFFDATRLDTGRIRLTLRPTDLAKLIKPVVAKFRPQLEAKMQHLTLYIRPNLPLVLGDELRVVQIISTLLDNAHKYTPEGGQITLNLASAEEAEFLQLSVADNGLGIAPEDQEHLFDPFFRAKNAFCTEANGTGLELHIAHALAELLRGRLWFESEPGQGSIFYLTLPVAN